MNLAPVRTVAPSVPLVTLSELKQQCRVDHDDEDLLLDGLIKAATAHLDGYSGILGRALLEQTWQLDLCDFPSCLLRLPVGNLISVESITYYDTSNVQQTLSGSTYSALSDRLGPFVALKNGFTWPSVYSRLDAVSVIWKAGYGATAATVPDAIKQGALLLAAHWYSNREAVNVGAGLTAIELPLAVASLTAPYRRVSI